MSLCPATTTRHSIDWWIGETLWFSEVEDTVGNLCAFTSHNLFPSRVFVYCWFIRWYSNGLRSLNAFEQAVPTRKSEPKSQKHYTHDDKVLVSPFWNRRKVGKFGKKRGVLLFVILVLQRKAVKPCSCCPNLLKRLFKGRIWHRKIQRNHRKCWQHGQNGEWWRWEQLQ